MGRRPGDSEGARSRLGEDDAGNLAQLAADLVDQRAARFAMRLPALLALGQEALDAGRGSPDQRRGAAVEPALLRLARNRPCSGDFAVHVILWSRSEAAVDQP